jgi:Domain of unknown function (DUF4383)
MSYEYWSEIRGATATTDRPAPNAKKSGRRARWAAKTPKAAPKMSKAESPAQSGVAGGRSLAQVFAFVIGATFVLVGVLGFVPGIVRMFGDLSFKGPESDAQLLGLFDVSVVHNIVHLLFGIGLLASRRAAWAVRYLLIGGIAYAAVFIYGLFVVNSTSSVNFLPINTADNILHIVLSVTMIALGVIGAAALRRQPALV